MLKSPETAIDYHESAWRLIEHLLARELRIVAGDLWNIPRYVLHTLIGVAVVCGVLSLWEAHGDGTMPGMSPLSGIDPYRISSARCIDDKTTAEARWSGLPPALAILDQVNPTVAKWLRQKHAKGLVVFGDEGLNKADPMVAFAKYDMLRGRVHLSRELFSENDGTIAVTLCHEYRHSRESGKWGHYVLSFLFVRDGDASIIENDAVVYEQEAHNAIFGDGTSRERELAAWVDSAQPRISQSG